MLQFRSKFDEHNIIASEAGLPIKEQFVGQYDNNGQLVLVSTGVKNTYDEIQSFRDSVDINVIIKKYLAGDETVLNRIQGTFMDVTEMPKTYMDALNMTKRAEAEFDALPLSIKEKFGNNFAAYMAELGTDSWMEKLGLTKENESASSKIAEKDVDPAPIALEKE